MLHFKPHPKKPICWLILWLVVNCSGCNVFPKVKQLEPETPPPHHRCLCWLNDCDLDAVEQTYKQALEADEDCCSDCVKLYFQVAVATCRDDGPADPDCRRRVLHKAALAKFVETGQHYGALDPTNGLHFDSQLDSINVSISRHGFVWSASDFQELVPVGNYKTKTISQNYRRAGVGIPMVVLNNEPHERKFVPDTITFPATLCMRVESHHQGSCSSCGDNLKQVRLELYDPLRIRRTNCNRPKRIVRDTGAALAYRVQNEPVRIWGDFVNPNSTLGDGRLRILEPYQRGKIPIVLLHGLLSSPYTWVEAVNEMAVEPGFLERYQIWVFDYPTGESFLNSAAALREQLRQARAEFDPQQRDPEYARMVLIGHSMGGLIAKLQISDSGDRLWRGVANRPFNEVVIQPEYRSQIERAFFFRSSRDIKRVIFIGTPHTGSLYARRIVGRLGSVLVNRPDDQKQAHRQLMDRNPGVFREEVQRRIPTSIDMLEPNNPLLQSIAALPISPWVKTHAIVGNYKSSLLYGESDGVVSVTSATTGVEISTRYVTTKHTDLNKHPESLSEVFCILRQHANVPATTPEKGLPVASRLAPGHQPRKPTSVRVH